MTAIKAVKVADFGHCINPGEYYITSPNPNEDGMRRLSFRCPCGCGDLAEIRIREDGINDSKAWGWNKDEVCPTVTPSICIGPGEHWHGYLRNGVFESC